MTKKKLLILGAQRLQEPLYKKASELNLTIIGIDPKPSLYCKKSSDHFYTIDLANYSELKKIASRHSVDGIVTAAADFPVIPLSQLCHDFNLKGLSIDSAMAATQKSITHQKLEKNQVKCPHTMTLTDGENYDISTFKGPFIIKPEKSSGSRGVSLCSTFSNSKEIDKSIKHAFNYSLSSSIILQEYLEGPEYSIESITINNKTHVLAITDKFTSGPPNFVERGHSQPSQCSHIEIEDMKQLTKEGIAALGLNNCCCHTEIKYNLKQPYIIEVGPRLGGDYITSHLTQLSYGIDLLKANIDLALNNSIELSTKTVPTGSAIRFISTNPGIIKSINYNKELLMQQDIIDFQIYIKEGDSIDSINGNNLRCGHVITQNKDIIKAIQAADDISKSVQIHTEA